ncbi:MAG TPA: hypothetical protein DEA44_09125 [Firmicutes bacterium]|nr:hypothetical protein [Bacillota bacterium]
MEYLKTIANIFMNWQVKTVVSFFLATMTFFLGSELMPFLALFFLMAMDVLTRWMAEGKRKADQVGIDSWLEGFYLCWHDGTLNSKTMGRKFFHKAITYMLLVIAFNLALKSVPSIVLFGADWSKLPLGFIYSFLSITEVMSVIENLIDAGMDALRPLCVFVCKKRNDLTGGGDKNVQAR